MCKANRPIGVFDSGVGGLSVVGEMMRQLPQEDFYYYGDTAHAPYGTKPVETVLTYVQQVMDVMHAVPVKAVVIACNTATSCAAALLRQTETLPIIGMEPALKPAQEMRHGGQILVLATPVTLSLPKFQRLMAQYGDGALPLPCPGLMELVEKEDFATAKTYLSTLFQPYDLSRVDAVVLGCTHYVFLRPLLSQLLPPTVHVLDGNAGTARQLQRVLSAASLLREGGQGTLSLHTSGRPEESLPPMLSLAQRAGIALKDVAQ